jgi:hypothetical protein
MLKGKLKGLLPLKPFAFSLQRVLEGMVGDVWERSQWLAS